MSNLVRAIYAFKGKNNDELCFKKGDVITVSQREEGGWWEGTLGETTGWFPNSYVRELESGETAAGSPTSPPPRAPAEIQAFRNVVLEDVVESERAHVAELRNLVDHFLAPLERAEILAPDEYRQLTGNIVEIVGVHERLLEAIEESGQRPGGVFLRMAPNIERVHRTYCERHPRAVCVLDRHKDELNEFMERSGAVRPGLLVLTAGLSKPFRRLQKYAAMLQELGRHVLESHPDRGDTHRALAVYKEMAASCAAARRQKELELQVVTGAVRGWQGKDLAELGEVLHMGGVALGRTHADRYFVLFPSTLLILSVSRRMSAFVYEGRLALAGVDVAKLEDQPDRKNAFQITGPLIEPIIAVCQSAQEADAWVALLRRHSDPPLKLSPMEGSMSAKSSPQNSTNHKRSHSFNNHHSYTQFLQQQQKQKDYQNEKNSWIQSSCDALLSQNSLNSSRTPSSFSPNLDRQDRYSINSTFEGWTSRNLRPAPPLRPLGLVAGEDSNQPYALSQRKTNSYEEDGLILRVIEAYCTSARSRNTVNSVDLGHLSRNGKFQTHTQCSAKFHPSGGDVAEFDVCHSIKPLANNKSRSRNPTVDCINIGTRPQPKQQKLLTQRKKLNRSNPSIAADLARCDSGSPLRRSAPMLDAPSRRASSPLLGRDHRMGGRGAVLLPARAPSLPLASAWCCGSFVKQLRKTHHFD